MAVALVPSVGDQRQLAHLVRVQRAVRDGDAQHIGVQLQIEAVHQAQRAEFILGQAAIQTAADLIGELRDAGADEGFVEVGIVIHWYRSTCLPWA